MLEAYKRLSTTVNPCTVIEQELGANPKKMLYNLTLAFDAIAESYGAEIELRKP